MAKLIFVPFPLMSHLVSTVNTAALLADRHTGLSIAVLIMTPRLDTKITSFTTNSPHPCLSFIHLPLPDPDDSDPDPTLNPENIIIRFIESQKPAVRTAVAEIASEEKLTGFVLDMFCASMTDVADEFNLPSYVFFSSGSAMLGMLFHLQSLRDDRSLDLKEFLDSDAAVAIPTFVNPVPARVWPVSVFDEGNRLLDMIKEFHRTKGIIVNSFLEFETHAINSLAADENLPPVFPVGPILQSAGDSDRSDKINTDEIIAWLDQQPDSSVVYLCFGSIGSFDRDQVTEIARALEKLGKTSGIRFLWSLRKPPPPGKMEFPSNYEDPEEVLPEGFLERTAGLGKVIGWSPQMAVLSHAAVAVFVSHGGWNSTLESIWCGVPMAIWPLYAEQQANAFQLVVELEMAVEVKMDYRSGSGELVGAETVEAAVRRVMEEKSGIREKVWAFSEKSKGTLKEDGSSYLSLGRFIETVFHNIS